MHKEPKFHTNTVIGFPEGISGRTVRRPHPRGSYGIQRARVIGCVSYRGPNGMLQTVPTGICRVDPQADGYRLTWTVDRVDVSVVVDPLTYGEHLARKQIRPL